MEERKRVLFYLNKKKEKEIHTERKTTKI